MKKVTVVFQPGFQYMASSDDAKTIEKRHKEHKKYYKATNKDVTISRIFPYPQREKTNLKSRWCITYHTYIGWKVYMLSTGCFGQIPAYETD